MEESDIVALHIIHRAAHAREAFAEAQVVRWIVLRRFTLRPIPIPSVLDVHDIERMVVHNLASCLESKVVDATEALLKYLRRHDGGPDGEDYAIVESFD